MPRKRGTPKTQHTYCRECWNWEQLGVAGNGEDIGLCKARFFSATLSGGKIKKIRFGTEGCADKSKRKNT